MYVMVYPSRKVMLNSASPYDQWMSFFWRINNLSEQQSIFVYYFHDITCIWDIYVAHRIRPLIRWWKAEVDPRCLVLCASPCERGPPKQWRRWTSAPLPISSSTSRWPSARRTSKNENEMKFLYKADSNMFISTKSNIHTQQHINTVQRALIIYHVLMNSLHPESTVSGSIEIYWIGHVSVPFGPLLNVELQFTIILYYLFTANVKKIFRHIM